MPNCPPKAFLTKDRKERWTNFSVLRHGAFDGFFVSSKNSGTHWMLYMFSVALADTYGIPRPAYFSENATRPYVGFPTDAPVFEQLPRFAKSHSIPHELASWPWARAAVKLPPYVLCVRHPMGILASHYAKWQNDIQVSWPDYLRGDPAGKQFRCDLYWIARFWNRWGDISASFPGGVRILQYEATRANPRAALEAMAKHWGVALTPEAIQAALEAGTKEAMAKRIDPDAEPNVLQNRQEALDELFTGDAMEIYAERVRDLVRHDLGYDLLTPPVSETRSSALQARI